jgi:hypothetical protein
MLSPARIGLLALGVYVVLHTLGLDPVPPVAARIGADGDASVVAATAPREPDVVARKQPEPASHVAVAHRASRPARAPESRRAAAPAPRVARTIAQPAPRAGATPTAPTVDAPRPDAKKPEPQQEPPATRNATPTPVAPPPVHLTDPPPLPLPDPTTLVDPGALQPVVVPLAPLPAVPALP